MADARVEYKRVDLQSYEARNGASFAQFSLSGTCVEFGPTQLPVNSFRVRVRVRVRVRAYRKLGRPEPDTSAAFRQCIAG